MIYRRDAADIKSATEREVLAHYGLAADNLIGQGTEARVYALDGERVLKIYAGQEHRPALEALADFYRRLDATGLPYSLPLIHEIHPHGDLLAIVERRINGTPMEEYVTPDDPALEDLYLRTVTTLAQVRITPPLDRFMLLENPAVGSGASSDRGDWHAFLAGLIRRRLPDVLPLLRKDIRDIDFKIDKLLARFGEPYSGHIGIIHGDLYPGNILMLDRNSVTGVIDFGTFTMIGDPLYDLAAACGFYRMYEDDHPQARDRLLRKAAAPLSAEDREALHSYLLTGALLSCDLYPQEGVGIRDTCHYRWAAAILDVDLYWADNGHGDY